MRTTNAPIRMIRDIEGKEKKTQPTFALKHKPIQKLMQINFRRCFEDATHVHWVRFRVSAIEIG